MLETQNNKEFIYFTEVEVVATVSTVRIMHLNSFGKGRKVVPMPACFGLL